MLNGIRNNPPVMLLVFAVSCGLGGAAFTATHFFRNDPTLLLVNKKKNPYPWLNVDQGTNIKFYSVNQKFDASIKKGYRDDL
ncbi:hypothetical protein HDU83_005936 [Entophlyctis luteolus]|nr:hypothetical protein HDU82_007541 [Entophlyctis luteolus]KAJ3342857.1 hypothetical protein HDU83_005936 [Entophlyctis luteolus]